MKKRLLITLGLSICFLGVFGQQKVKDGTIAEGNLANKDALLELESTNKGLLHARVALIESTNPAPLTAHVAGMMVYNTATSKDVVPGIYYNDGTKWVYIKGLKGDPGVIAIEAQPGKTGTPGAPGAGVTIVTNDSGTWVYNPTTNTWTNINGPKGDKGDKGDAGIVGVEGQPGKTGTPGIPGSGTPGAPGAGVTIVTNDSGTWVYNPTTNSWTNINGAKGDKGDKGDAGVVGVEGQPGKTGTPGTPGSGTPGAPGAGITIVTNDSGTWVYNPTTNSWTNINGAKGDKGDKGDAGVVGVEGQPGKTGTPGTPGSG
ncbi:hypothetical protein HDC90_003787, partial [Pedobacter sp. AK013]|nr:hypothetical protein [Pedobacter sp. AK013]